jgi:hypothetical protein
MDRPRDPDLAARLFGGRPEHTLALLRAVWPGAVGEELSRRTELVALDKGVLRIRVSDLRWQRQLQRMRGPILGRLRRAAGQVAPSQLGFVTGEIKAPAAPATPAPPTRPAREAPPIVAEAASAIPDAAIREGFLAAAARYLDRFGQAGSGGGPTPSGGGSTASD